MKYAAIRMAVQRTPWAILPSKFAEIYHFLLAKAEDQQPDEQRIRRALAERDARERERYAAFGVQARNGNSLPFPVVRGAAVIPILGTIIPRASLLAEMSGAISTERLRRNLRLADEDREIEEILLDIASPGGAVPGVQETYQDVKRIARRKKVTAYANHYAASAAYYIASAASELKVAPSGDVGSVGVFAAHEDWSKHLEMAGVGVEIIRSDNSPYKYEGNMFEPLPDEARAEIKRVVNVYEQQFHSDVSKGRKVPIATVREDFGMGRMRLAKEAVEAGMADAIATLEEDVLARAATRRSTVAVSRRTQHKETPMSSITEQIKEKAAAVANWLKSPTDDDEARGQVLASMKDVEAFLAEQKDDKDDGDMNKKQNKESEAQEAANGDLRARAETAEARVQELEAELAAAQASEETEEAKAEEKVAQADPEVQRMIRELEAKQKASDERAANAEKMAREERQRREFAEMVKHVETNYPLVSGSAEDHAKTLIEAKANLSEDGYKAVEDAFAFGQQAASSARLVNALGVDGEGNPSAWAQIEAEAKKLAKDKNISQSAALAEVSRSNPELYARYKQEQRSHKAH